MLPIEDLLSFKTMKIRCNFFDTDSFLALELLWKLRCIVGRTSEEKCSSKGWIESKNGRYDT